MRHLTILLVLANRFVKYPERFLISLVSEFHSVVAPYKKINLTQSFRYTVHVVLHLGICNFSLFRVLQL